MHPLLFGWPAVPPASAADWLPWIAIAAMVLGLLARSVRFVPAKRYTVRAIVVLMMGIVSALGPLRSGSIPRLEMAATLLVFLALTLIVMGAAEANVEARRGAAGPLVLMVFAVGASQVLMLAFASLRLGQAVGVAGAALGGIVLVSFVRPRLTLSYGGIHVPVLLGQTCLLQGVLYTETGHKRMYPLLLALSPVLALLGGVGPLAQLRGWRSTLVRVILALIPVCIALAIAAMNQPAEEF